MFCKKCGLQIDDDSVFCQKCGEKQLHETDMESTYSNSDKEAKNISSSFFRKVLKTTISKIIIGVLVVAIFATGIIIITNTTNSDESKETNSSSNSISNTSNTEQSSSQFSSDTETIKLKPELTEYIEMSLSELIEKKGEPNPGDTFNFQGRQRLDVWNEKIYYYFYGFDWFNYYGNEVDFKNEFYIKESDGIFFRELSVKIPYSGKVGDIIADYSNFFDGFIPGITPKEFEEQIGYPVETVESVADGGNYWSIKYKNFNIIIFCESETKISSLNDIYFLLCYKVS